MKVLGYYGFCAAAAVIGMGGRSGLIAKSKDKPQDLPPPVLVGRMSLEEAMANRRSVREFLDIPLTTKQISQLCWAGQGITNPKSGFRTSPSAGALYPIELYVVTAEGVDHYQPTEHRLKRHLTGDLRQQLQQVSLDQEAIGQAALCVVIAGVEKRTAQKYEKRALRYCFIEAGHVAQNILLQATALNLAGVPMGAFEDDKVAKTLKLPQNHRVLYLLVVGHPVEFHQPIESVHEKESDK